MSRLINVFVCDSKGYGLSGCRVNLYGGDTERTNNNGSVSLMADGSNCTVYVDGREVYDGSVSRAPDPIVCRKS